MIGRTLVVFGLLAMTAVAVVHIRAEQTRCVHRILKMEREWVEARRELWAIETRGARARTPERVRSRVAMQRDDLVPPEADTVVRGSAQVADRGGPDRSSH